MEGAGSRPLRFTPPPLPREHGAWAMLAIPPCLGWAAAGRLSPASAAGAGGIAALFLARAWLLSAIRDSRRRRNDRSRAGPAWLWGTLAASAGTAGLTAAVTMAPREASGTAAVSAAAVALLGAAHFAASLLGYGRSVAAEFAGMAGLSACGPLVAGSAGVTHAGTAASAGLLSLAYFVSSFASVRTFQPRKRKMGQATCLAIHVLLGTTLAGLARVGWLSPATLLAFVPAYARLVWYAASPPASLPALGWREVASASAFAASAVTAFVVSADAGAP